MKKIPKKITIGEKREGNMKPLDLQVTMNSLLRYSRDQNIENHKGVMHQIEIDEKAVKDARRSTQKVNENEESAKADWQKEKNEKDITDEKNKDHSNERSSDESKKNNAKEEENDIEYKNHCETGHKDFYA